MQEGTCNKRTSERGNRRQEVGEYVAGPFTHRLRAGKNPLCFVTGTFLLMPRQRGIEQPLEAPHFGTISRIQAHAAQHAFAR